MRKMRIRVEMRGMGWGCGCGESAWEFGNLGGNVKDVGNQGGDAGTKVET